jgi:LysM repeat protein
MGRIRLRMIVILVALAVATTGCFDSGSSSDDRPEDETTESVPASTTPTTVSPVTTSTTDRPVGEPLVYTVQPGDTLAAIAQNFNTTVELLTEVNNIADPNALQVGQELIIPAPGTTPGVTTSSSTP